MEPLIADLALILICAGAMTLIFKRLHQPLVLGYIVAGFLASPNMPYMPSVTDMENVHLWSDIGVIFLLFAAKQFLAGYRQKLVVQSAKEERAALEKGGNK